MENGLPDDPLAEILSHLPAKSLCRFKCVSKHWRDLIAGRLRCRNHPCTLEGFFYGCVDDDKIDYGGSEDSDEGDDGEDSDEGDDGEEGGGGGGGEDGAEGGGVDDADEGDDGGENFPGHFMNLSERYVPLVDPQFSFLRNQPGVEKITLFSSCSGLLLFTHTRDWSRYETPGEILQKNCSTQGYIVCNPTTEHWVPVPSSTFHSTPFSSKESLDEEDFYFLSRNTHVQPYLVFDPAISLHFELIELRSNYLKGTAEACAYSSETGRWGDASYGREPWSLWGTSSAFLNGLLHVFAWVDRPSYEGHWIVVAIDRKGNTCREIDWSPQRPSDPIFLGQSQGYLHSISFNETDTGFSIWILEDYHAEKWNLKHTVSFLRLFGREITAKICEFDDYWDFKAHCNVVAIHPDCNEFFVVWENELISYDMDRDALADCNVGRRHGRITPYFPYFSELPALSKQH